MESERNFVPKPEKPKFVYHGSRFLFEQVKPQEGHKPSHEQDAPARVYASPNPAFAVAQGGFSWESREGVECEVVNDQVILRVPENLAHRLDNTVYLYKMSGDSFSNTTSEGSGQTWDSEELVTPEEEPQTFSSVTEAVEHFGGVVEIIKD